MCTTAWVVFWVVEFVLCFVGMAEIYAAPLGPRHGIAGLLLCVLGLALAALAGDPGLPWCP